MPAIIDLPPDRRTAGLVPAKRSLAYRKLGREANLAIPHDGCASEAPYAPDLASIPALRRRGHEGSRLADRLWQPGADTAHPAPQLLAERQHRRHRPHAGRAPTFLQAHGLEDGRFICVIPRLRYTPYYRIRSTPRTPADDIRDGINERTTDTDHARIRDLVVSYGRSTGNSVLACAEMTYQVELARDVLVEPLPSDVRRNVVWRDTYWLPDEAASIYAKAAAVVSMKCHSPLIALRNGTPAFYVRQPTDTTRGQMYRDVGADDWFFEIEETGGSELWSRLKTIHDDPVAARAKVTTIMHGIEHHQRRMVEAVRAACGHPPA